MFQYKALLSLACLKDGKIKRTQSIIFLRNAAYSEFSRLCTGLLHKNVHPQERTFLYKGLLALTASQTSDFGAFFHPP